MPCSPVQVPSRRSARCTICSFSRSTVARSAGVVRVDQVAEVEVAVADMADDPVRQPGRLGLGHRLVDALGQARDRHAGVGAHGSGSPGASAARRSRPGGARSTAACAPRACCAHSKSSPPCSRAIVLHRLRPAPATPASLPWNSISSIGASRSARLRVLVDGADRVRVEQFAARDRHAHLDDLDRRAHRRVDAREVADRRAHRLGQRVELERDLGHHAERALAADEQPRQVVAGARLLRPRAGADDLAARGDDGQRRARSRASCRSARRSCRWRAWRPCRRAWRWRRGRSGRTGPVSRISRLSCSRVTPACTVTVRSSALTRNDAVHARQVDR